MTARPMALGILLVLALLCAACGSSSTAPEDDVGIGDTGNTNGSDDDGNDGDDEEPCEPSSLPWMASGNFWNVSWSWLEAGENWWQSTSYADYDAGAYTMQLGASSEVEGLTMYDLETSGNVDEFAPLWSRIGTDGCGNVYGQASAGTSPVLVYSETDSEWSGTGFWTDFTEFSGSVSVSRGASMISSQYTDRLPYFEPPLTAVGHASDETNYSPGGCDYFPGYGTICTEASSGPTEGTRLFEYWDAEAGPVGMHLARDYEDCLGVACESEHVERRVEVWFFGDAGSEPIRFEQEPDSYADPTEFPLSEDLFAMFGAISEYDVPSGYLGGYDAGAEMDLAAAVHDWFAFEVPPELAGRTVEFYLAWDADVELGFHLFSAPDNGALGFAYLAESLDFPEWEETSHARFFSGQFQAGTYLLGVIRNTEAETETRYGVIGVAEAEASAAAARVLSAERLRDGMAIEGP